jgi:hypothetical protein
MTAQSDTVRLSGTRWDKIQNTRGPDRHLSIRTDRWRTATGHRVAETRRICRSAAIPMGRRNGL